MPSKSAGKRCAPEERFLSEIAPVLGVRQEIPQVAQQVRMPRLEDLSYGRTLVLSHVRALPRGTVATTLLMTRTDPEGESGPRISSGRRPKRR